MAARIEHRGVVWVVVSKDNSESVFWTEAEAKAAFGGNTAPSDFAAKMAAAKAAKKAKKEDSK